MVFEFLLRRYKSKRNLLRNLISKLSETSNKLLGVGLRNFSFEIFKTFYDTEIRIWGLELFHSLIVYGKCGFVSTLFNMAYSSHLVPDVHQGESWRYI